MVDYCTICALRSQLRAAECGLRGRACDSARRAAGSVHTRSPHRTRTPRTVHHASSTTQCGDSKVRTSDGDLDALRAARGTAPRTGTAIARGGGVRYSLKCFRCWSLRHAQAGASRGRSRTGVAKRAAVAWNARREAPARSQRCRMLISRPSPSSYRTYVFR